MATLLCASSAVVTSGLSGDARVAVLAPCLSLALVALVGGGYLLGIDVRASRRDDVGHVDTGVHPSL